MYKGTEIGNNDKLPRVTFTADTTSITKFWHSNSYVILKGIYQITCSMLIKILKTSTPAGNWTQVARSKFDWLTIIIKTGDHWTFGKY